MFWLIVVFNVNIAIRSNYLHLSMVKIRFNSELIGSAGLDHNVTQLFFEKKDPP